MGKSKFGLYFCVHGVYEKINIMKQKILHVFKKNYKLEKNYYLGATKDIFGRTEFFKNRKIDYKELLPINIITMKN